VNAPKTQTVKVLKPEKPKKNKKNEEDKPGRYIVIHTSLEFCHDDH